MRIRLHIVLALALLATLVAAAAVAQNPVQIFPGEPEPGAEANPEETTAYELAIEGQYIRARNTAQQVLRAHPRSYVAHYVLGLVQSYAEADFPRALFELNTALRLYEAAHGTSPSAESPWKWHSRLLRALSEVHNNLEHYEERLRIIARYNEFYRPHITADRAWSLMKLGRYDEARRAAQEALASGDDREETIALTSLCAIEFEAGHDGASYDVCRRALENARGRGDNLTVELANFAEASRSLFKLAEAEDTIHEATTAGITANGNPWMDLGELYTREGRFVEAFHALQEVPAYRMQRPAEYRDADRNETRRALAGFLVVIDRPQDALRITEKALVSPDRRAHQSRDPVQDRSIVALLDREAHLMAAEKRMERAASESWWKWPGAFATASWLRFQAWMSGRKAAALLSDNEHLVGAFRIGTAHSAVMPPWLVGDITHVVGSGVAAEAIARARRVDHRSGASAYYDAFAAEAAFANGESDRARAIAIRALRALPEEEALLRARVQAIAATACMDLADRAGAGAFYDGAFQVDPGVFRRLGLVVPVRVSGSGDALDVVLDSPRITRDDSSPLSLRVESGSGTARACILGSGDTVIGCAEVNRQTMRGQATLAGALGLAFNEEIFAPRINLSQSDITSLDGSNRVGRDPLRDLMNITGDTAP
ncbi:MAG: tetratricopeptide repeat protein [Sandaracinaceae bacterium]|nr:tetratricopeptide repeat protein [Sandaracinaceae bacterium]